MKSAIIKCLGVGFAATALAGCLQKPLPPDQFLESMSAADGTCVGVCSTKVTLEVKNYKYKLSSDKKMREALTAGALKCYWYAALQGTNDMTLTYWGQDGKQLIYNVNFSADGYTLTYEDSASMKYNEETGEIHPLYDLWFWGGGTWGSYGLVPTLDGVVRQAYQEENKRGKPLFGGEAPEGSGK